jgi:predicted RNA-binding protein with PUA-like domain
MEVVSAPYPDPTQFDPDHRYFDPKATQEQPRWVQVDVQYIRHTQRLITLEELKNDDQLGESPLFRRGNRLSIMPVGLSDWQRILDREQLPELK